MIFLEIWKVLDSRRTFGNGALQCGELARLGDEWYWGTSSSMVSFDEAS